MSSEPNDSSSSTEAPVTEPKPPMLDRYGFLVSEDSMFHKRLEVPAQLQRWRLRKELQREKKWIDMISAWRAHRNGEDGWKTAKLRRRVRKGIPDAVRLLVWQDFLHLEDAKRKYGRPPTQEQIDSTLTPIVLEDIDKDIDRTYPTHEMFMINTTTDVSNSNKGDSTDVNGDPAKKKGTRNVFTRGRNAGGGLETLRLLLERYAVMDMETGYCQGMSFIAAFLLSYIPPDEAFYCFTWLMKDHGNFPLRAMYQPDMFTAQSTLHVFGRLLSLHLPKLWGKLESQGLHQSMYASLY
jgi:hypothetical protein